MGLRANAQPGPGAVRRSTLGQREARLAYLLVTPTYLIVVGIVLFPALFSLWIAFHKVGLADLSNVLRTSWVGFSNFRAVINDFAFPASLRATLVYAFASSILTTALGLAAALILNREFRGKGLTRAIFLVPYVAPVIATAVLWRWLLEPNLGRGAINYLLVQSGLLAEPKAWLSTPGLALAIVILYEGWRYFPFAMLMLLARLQAVDHEMYEAADVDGANFWQKFRFITLPELRFVLGTVFLLRLIWTFNKFDDIFLLTSGGYGTKVLSILTYEFAFRTFDFGKGAATAVILFLILVGTMIVYVKKVLQW